MKLKKRTLLFFAVVLLTVIVGYNTWSYCCGYCTLDSLASFSDPALVLIACNLLAGVTLSVVKLRRCRLRLRQRCRCGEQLRSAWTFCPACGVPRS